MKHLFLALASFVMLPVSAQWELFPLGQRSYFQDMSQAGIQVDMVLMDSVRVDPNEGTRLYNRTSIHEQLFGACAWPVMQQMGSMYQGLGYSVPMDSLLERNDTVFYFSSTSTLPFYFLPKASAGQSWTVASTYAANTFSDIEITCIGVTMESILGIQDSVKTFSLAAVGAVAPINNFQVRLSKHHGLVEYVPFEQFLYHPSWVAFKAFQLIGLELDGTAYKYRQPAFADYFHLSVGDVLLWRTDVHPWSIADPPYTTYRRDSIVAVEADSDSVRYTCHGIRQFADGSVVPFQGLQVVYRKAAVDGLLGAAPNDLASGKGVYYGWDLMWLEEPGTIWHSGPLELTLEPNGLDTTTSFSFQSWGDFVETACQVMQAVDWNYEWRIDTRAGLSRCCANFGMGTACTEIIGSWINGELHGDITLGLGDRAFPGAGLGIYPNPAADRIFVAGPWRKGGTYAIMDGSGRLVRSGMLGDGGIAVDDLPGGLYVLRMSRAGGAAALRFTIE
ncbi:MAG: T9SS type A sorting domain-containing protein [Flavobacteriales bacterium]|nr:T9SS type A sorting domain-containing protein [Flavobacteriales bacterium]MBP9079293.1 T9SS type A sorting domain-containing protein [Flavobacteriales bacterium]